MKTGTTILCLASLLLLACGDRKTASAAGPEAQRSGILLTTKLPPAHPGGTPKPIRLPMRTPGYGSRP